MTLQQLKQLCAKATPGPWKPQSMYSSISLGNKIGTMAATGPIRKVNPKSDFTTEHLANQIDADSELIAAARNHIEELIARIEKMHQAILWSGSNDWTPPDAARWNDIVNIVRACGPQVPLGQGEKK